MRTSLKSAPPLVEGRSLDLVLQNAGRWRGLRPRALHPWLEAVVGALAPEVTSLGVRFCGDCAIRELNRQFRGRDEVTDVLSFPGEAAMEEGHLGDVVVCVPRARCQAAERGDPLEREIRTLLLHGVLHCLGYDHETDDGEMDRLERRLRRRWLQTP
ncbi:MAG TPA: rRNA maturation RNase YbeY [Thermoanaerobaculia bacterium]|nr:rRNA maturation RNase YbeY [Thermoanaerobaculia bacterium]